MTPAIFAAIPFVGELISGFLVLTTTVIGAKIVYRIETFRAICVVLFPKLLFIGIILMGLVAFMMVFVNLFWSFF